MLRWNFKVSCWLHSIVFESAINHVSGEHHYHEHLGFEAFGISTKDETLYSERDKQKEESCEAAGITLVPVPYWYVVKRNGH